MKSKHLGNEGLWLGIIAMVLGTAGVAQAAASSAKGGDESHKGARLLQGIRADAMQVRSAAMRLDSLTKSSGAKWLDYDQQWNEIKPAVEDMQIKLAHLETMQAAISPAERKEVDQSKMLIGGIQNMTFELRALLDKPGVQTSDEKFKVYASSLRNVAGKLEKTAAAS